MTALSAFVITATVLLGQTEAEQSALPDNIVKELECFVGNWTVEGDVLGMDLKGRWNAKWSPRKHCLLISYPLNLDGERVFGNGIMGWDTEKEELLILMFYSNGVHENVRYTVESPGLFKGVFAGSADGEPFKATCEMRTNQSNEWTFQTKGHTVGGKSEGELTVRFTRSTDTPKGKNM